MAKNNHLNSSDKFDIAIIGAGSGGLVAAEVAASIGVKVILIDKSEADIGGECLHSGCVPSKSLIHSAKNTDSNWLKSKKKLELSISKIKTDRDNKKHYEGLGVEVAFGVAELKGGQQIMVGDRLLKAKKIILATGSKPTIPEIPGLSKINYLTNETVFRMQNKPKHLAIIGGGPIAVELAFAFKNLGSKVTIIEHNPRLLGVIDEEAADLVVKQLKLKKVDIHTSAKVTKLSKSKARLVNLQVGKFNDIFNIQADTVLVATGRTANSPSGLKVAGVTCDQVGVVVDERWCTKNKNIYAVGDCSNFPLRFTHVAAGAASQVVVDATLLKKMEMDPGKLPYVFFSEPEVGQVGPTEDKLAKTEQAFSTFKLDYCEIDKAVVENEEGFIKVLTDQKGKLLSATVVGKHAGETIGYIASAMAENKTLDQLTELVIPYPTYSYGLKQLAFEAKMERNQKYRPLFKIAFRLRNIF